MKHNQKGMTLIEIMVSLLIGAFLIGGVIKIFTNTHQTYRVQENLSRIQESGRFAMDILTRSVRMSGFQGCASVSDVTPSVIAAPATNPVPPSLALGSISGNNNVANNWNASACGVGNLCIVNTDAINIHSGDACGGGLTTAMTGVGGDILINAATNTCEIIDNDIVMISDCSSVDIFVADTAVSALGTQTLTHVNTENTSANLSKAYLLNAEVFAFNPYTFFIRTGASGEPSLYRLSTSIPASPGTNPVELIEGVENMQILYGEDTNADNAADYYVGANDVVSMGNVVSLRITLVIRSLEDNLTLTSRPYIINYVTVTPTDKRIRRVFTSTIAVRNRLP